jgi:phosphoglycolate phosphatase
LQGKRDPTVNDYLPINLITSLSPICYPLFTSIGFTDGSIELVPVTTYRETVIVKKDCVTNPSGNIELMPGFPRNFPKPTTIFCDFDGPIVDVSDRYYSTYHLALINTAEFYRELSPAPSAQTQIAVLTKAQFWQMKQDRIPDREIASQSGLDEAQTDFFLQRVMEIVNSASLLEQDKIQPGVTWALGLLRAQGCKLILVTLRDRDEAIRILEQHGLRQLFSGIYGTGNSQAAYQNYSQLKTKLLAQAMREHQINQANSDSWMIGDTEADLLAGIAMEIPTIALTCGIRSKRQLSQFKPTLIKDDLLCAAHHLVGINSLQACS